MRPRNETLEEWLERFQPDCEMAVRELVRLIYAKAPRIDLELMADYIVEFDQDTDPISMGWVGSDGLP